MELFFLSLRTNDQMPDRLGVKTNSSLLRAADPASVKFDPNSRKRSFQPNVRDLTYSVYRPDLAALGAIDGFMPSSVPIDNNEPQSRRDEGLEFIDVT
jgi:hypothetical protein